MHGFSQIKDYLFIPEIGIVISFILSLVGGIIFMSPMLEVLEIENYLVRWVILIGSVIELSVIAFHVGLLFRRPPRMYVLHNCHSKLAKDIRKIMENDDTIQKIQGTSTCQTWIIEEASSEDEDNKICLSLIHI